MCNKFFFPIHKTEKNRKKEAKIKFFIVNELSDEYIYGRKLRIINLCMLFSVFNILLNFTA